jgi:hypothetical protein
MDPKMKKPKNKKKKPKKKVDTYRFSSLHWDDFQRWFLYR